MSGLGNNSKICAVILASEIGIGSNNLFFSIKDRSFSKISLKDISSGPANSIMFSLISSVIILVIEFVKSEQKIGLNFVLPL